MGLIINYIDRCRYATYICFGDERYPGCAIIYNLISHVAIYFASEHHAKLFNRRSNARKHEQITDMRVT